MIQDFTRHNEEVRRVWEAYEARQLIRVPVGRFTIGPRVWLMDPTLNTKGITWEALTNDPEVMFQVLLKYKHFQVHNIISDIEMGIPDSHWEIFLEFNNIIDSTWLGCELLFPEGQIPTTRARYAGDRKNEIFDRGIPDPFGGILGQVKEFYEYFVDRAASYEFHGRPVKVLPPGAPLGTNGLLTVAAEIRGAEALGDMVLDPDYFHQLMNFLVEAAIARIKTWRKYLGLEDKPRIGGLVDDSIQMISTEAYCEHILPYHKRFFDELYGPGPHVMHLCGDVQRHFPTLIRELNVKTFDTGFPINFKTLRDEIGEDVEIQGGVRVDLLLHGTPEDVARETRRILESGIVRGGRFVMKEANNVPPGVPLENFAAMYETTRQFGVYE